MTEAERHRVAKLIVELALDIEQEMNNPRRGWHSNQPAVLRPAALQAAATYVAAWDWHVVND